MDGPRGRALAALAVALLPLVAGCLGSETDTPGPGTVPEERVALEGCHQLHLRFNGRAEDFQPLVPEGFAIVSDDPAGQTTSLFIVASTCTAAALPGAAEVPGPVLDVVLELHVEPPAALDDALSDVFVIERYVSHPELVSLFDRHGLDTSTTEHADIAVEPADTPVARTTALTVEAPDRSYTMDTVLQPSDGAFASSQVRVWTHGRDGATPTSHVRDSSPADNRGTGTVTFQATGDGGAPPLTAGLAHEVTGLTMVLTLPATTPSQ